MQTENNNFVEHKEPGWLNLFMWRCAGVDIPLLKKCPSDWSKYAGTGGTILFTAVMACLSGGYALETIFDNLLLAIIFGLMWGAMIFNLDRFMVNTMYSDGKHTISISEIKGGLPRIILAIFLGIVISTPIEMKIFDDVITENLPAVVAKANEKFELQKSLDVAERRRLEARVDSLNQVYNNPPAGSPETYSLLQAAKTAYEDACTKSQKELLEGGNGRGRGAGSVYNELKYREGVAKMRYDSLKTQYDRERAVNSSQVTIIRARISDELRQDSIELVRLRESIATVDNQKNIATSGLKNFSARLEAMYIGTSWSESPTLCVARFMIMFLFIVIEVIPVLFKMMVSFGPYDRLIEAERHCIDVMCEKRKSDINDEINTSVEISTKQNLDRLEAEVAANKQLLEKIASAQAEILSEAIELWRAQELEKVRNNPTAYIQTATNEHINNPINTTNTQPDEV